MSAPTLYEWAGATISDDEVYRYDLTRRWEQPLGFEHSYEDDAPELALWIMLNPSTADATQDDPTIRRCRTFSKREGAGGMVVVNVCALRATDPRALLGAHDDGRDHLGPENKQTIDTWLRHPKVSLAIAAWGTFAASSMLPTVDVRELALGCGRTLFCLGKTKTGDPRHPLYVKHDAPLVPYR